ALGLARQHYNIVLNYAADDVQAQETLKLCQQATPHVLLVKANVSNRHEVENLMQQSVQAFHSLDILINNAALVIDKPVHVLTEEDWDRVVDINMKGTFFCAQIASTYML
ncbi:MAG TPA: short-chain dehydrogenase, partial [Ktedonobacter sp.]|nr:short-chain dehydrogenase [Ktedonobacter sp.]